MRKNDVLRGDGTFLRVLEVREDRCLVIDCQKQTMPFWMAREQLEGLSEGEYPLADTELSREAKQVMHQRFTVIAPILPVIADEKQRARVIAETAEEHQISKQTVRKYLCRFLAYQDIGALAPAEKGTGDRVLSPDEKNMRWGLNKFFYTTAKNSLKTAYRLMLQKKYCDEAGKLKEKYPSFYQFRYFYRKTRKMQNYYISRDGIKNYQRDNRPCVGNSVQEYARNIGVGMLDSTICDIYLVDETGGIVGRPILTACVDAYSSLCCGYALSWEGGVYNLRNLMLNIILDKKEHCERFGISITDEIWGCKQLPGQLLTDKGPEYISETFSQLAELGITITNLPPYRPELKGPVEKFFDLIQGYFKPYLKGKGLIETDYQERGVHDYRKDACLTIDDFEKIVLHCVIFYNSQRILENFPYTEQMLDMQVKPFANCIWNYGREQVGANLIEISKEQLILTLLPRAEGKFSRYGLKVNKMRYHHENYAEQYLAGKSVTVAYNPDDVNFVWVLENGKYIRFGLIESRFQGKDLCEVEKMRKSQNDFVGSFRESNLQAEIDLASHIQVIARSKVTENRSIRHIRDNRRKEQRNRHKDMVKEVMVYE